MTKQLNESQKAFLKQSKYKSDDAYKVTNFANILRLKFKTTFDVQNPKNKNQNVHIEKVECK